MDTPAQRSFHVLPPTKTPLPHKNHGKEQRARICSVYWRPWVLHETWASAEVPHITRLHRRTCQVSHPEVIPGTRVRHKAKMETRSEDVGFRATWKDYVWGNVVSEHAVMLIRSFLTAYEGAEHDAEDRVEQNSKSIVCGHVPLSAKGMHDILQGMLQRDSRKE